MSVIRGRENQNFDQGGTGLALPEFENIVADTVLNNFSHLSDVSLLKKTTIISPNPSQNNEDVAIDVLQSKLLSDTTLNIFSTFGLGGLDTGELASVDEETYSFRCEYWALCADMSDRGIQLVNKMLSGLSFIVNQSKTILKPGLVLEFNLVGKFGGVIISQVPLGSKSVQSFTPSIVPEHKLFILHLYATPITKQELETFKKLSSENPDLDEATKAEAEWVNQFSNFLTTLENKAYSSRRPEFILPTS